MVAKIHALVVKAQEKLGVINLTGAYALQLEHEERSISISKPDEPVSELRRIGIASFNTLYGENGVGKTQIMFDLCATLQKSRSGYRCAVVFEEDGGLWVYKGAALGGWDVVSTELAVKVSPSPPWAEVIFYSTSPFEGARHRRFQRSRVRNVTPPFGQTLHFDGLTLVERFEELVQWEPFISKLEVTVRVKLPSPEEVVDQLELLLSKTEGFSDRGLQQRWPQRESPRNQLLEWFRFLPEGVRQSALIEFARAKGLTNHVVEVVLLSILNRGLLLPEHERSRKERFAAEIFDEIFDNFFQSNSHVEKLSGRDIWNFLNQKFNLLKIDKYREKFDIPCIREKLGLDDAYARLASRAAQQDGILSFELKDLSSGQTALLMLYTAIGSVLREYNDASDMRPTFVFLDEGEMFMHPAWQRRYISDIVKFIQGFGNVAPHVHVIAATHSLIVAGDSPPHSLLDVKTGETANGFGLGATSMLEDVYGVENFAGLHSEHWIRQLADYLRNPAGKIKSSRAADIAKQLADDDLREFALKRIDMGGENHD